MFTTDYGFSSFCLTHTKRWNVLVSTRPKPEYLRTYTLNAVYSPRGARKGWKGRFKWGEARVAWTP
jgi:hypothetical protein